MLGSEIKLRSYLRGALHPARQRRDRPAKPICPTDRWTLQTAAQVLDTVQAARAVWQENHIRAEAERRVRAGNIRWSSIADVDAAVDAVVARACTRTCPCRWTPARRPAARTPRPWTVDAVLPSGDLQVTHLRTRRRITLPAAYVSGHVELGHACTIHGAQGVTAATCHTVATGEESRQLFYVAMTRGRGGNHIYLTTAGDGDPHAVITREALLPPTAVTSSPASWPATTRPCPRPAPPAISQTPPPRCTRPPTCTSTSSPLPPPPPSARTGSPRSTPPPTQPCRT